MKTLRHTKTATKTVTSPGRKTTKRSRKSVTIRHVKPENVAAAKARAKAKVCA